MGDHDSRSSMLQDILDKIRTENKKQVVHCLIAISRLSPGIADKRDIGVHYEKLFKSCQQKYQGEGPTGILLVYPQHCVQLIEAPWEVLIDVVTDLKHMHSNGGLLVDSRLLSFSSNIPNRLYPQWSVRVLNLPALPKGEIYQTSDPLEVTVGLSLESLYKLGVHLSKLTQHQMTQTLDALNSKVPQLLLQQDVMEYYLKCDDLHRPTSFLDMYTNPPKVVLDGEVVWPLPSRLFPYDD